MAIFIKSGKRMGRPPGMPIRDKVAEWLKNYLSDAPQPLNDIKRASRSRAASWGTVKAAKLDLKIQSTVIDGVWYWMLPGASTVPVATTTSPAPSPAVSPAVPAPSLEDDSEDDLEEPVLVDGTEAEFRCRIRSWKESFTEQGVLDRDEMHSNLAAKCNEIFREWVEHEQSDKKRRLAHPFKIRISDAFADEFINEIVAQLPVLPKQVKTKIWDRSVEEQAVLLAQLDGKQLSVLINEYHTYMYEHQIEIHSKSDPFLQKVRAEQNRRYNGPNEKKNQKSDDPEKDEPF